MSIVILNQKEKELKDGDSVIRYRIPSPAVILDCLYAVLGKDYDLSKLSQANDIPFSDNLKLADSLAGQSILGWELVKDSDGNNLEYDKELIPYLQSSIKIGIFREAMDFLAGNLAQKSQKKKK
ncbi:MAG: hypothetical protein PHC43_09925 [Candidatus Marinimicrobia bacterium]|jgi:hypothetical protein|nr:hypothetical protein [Candidatus Neomarinimicrobiota bacterium]